MNNLNNLPLQEFNSLRPSFTENKENEKYVYSKEIFENTSKVFFNIPEPYVKLKYLSDEIDSLKNQILKDSDFALNLKNRKTQYIVPELVDVDYSVIQETDKDKFGEGIQFYKDGIIVSHNGNSKRLIELSVEENPTEKVPNNPFSLILDFLKIDGKTIFVSPEQYNSCLELIKNKGLIVYVTSPKNMKNKAMKIVFSKQSLSLSYLSDYIELLKKIVKDCSENIDPGETKKINQGYYFFKIFNYLPEEFKEKYLYPAMGVDITSRYIGSTINGKERTEQNMSETDCYNFLASKKNIIPSKLNLLQSSFVRIIIAKLTQTLPLLYNVYLREDKELIKLFEEYDNKEMVNIFNKQFSGLSEDLIAKKIVSIVFYEKQHEPSSYFKLAGTSGNHFGKSPPMFLYQVLQECTFLIQETNMGTTLPRVGDITYQNFSELDCYSYWCFFNVYWMSCGYAQSKGSILCHQFETGEEPRLDFARNGNLIGTIAASNSFIKDKKIEPSDDILETIEKLKQEIEDSGTGEWIPYNSIVEYRDDPRFKCARFIENEYYIHIFFKDQNNREMFEVYSKRSGKFAYYLLNSEHFNEDDVTAIAESVYIKIMGVIRDFKIIIDRESVMGYRGYRSPSGVNTKENFHTYLPRVRYHRIKGPEQVIKEKQFWDLSRNASGERKAHVRRLPDGHKPSRTQLILAEKNNYPVPPQHTYVSESMWGVNGQSQKEKTYRSKSFTGLLYVSEEDRNHTQFINQLSPAGFEEQMSKFLERTRKWRICERNNYDGGIDIRAYKDFKDGSTKKLLVQCKHWKNAVPPGVIRELLGSAQLDKEKIEKVLMVITSGCFSSGAIDLAKEHNIELIDGDVLLNEME